MPRVRATGDRPDDDRLYGAAAPQAGYFTLNEAAEAGYSSPLVEYHVKTGRFERVRRGLFRLLHFPPTEHEDLVVVWLWSRKVGIFSHLTALAMHQLSDALPAKIHLTVPASWRRRRLRVPPGLLLHHREVKTADVAWQGPVPLTSPLRSVVDVLSEEDPALGEQAAAEAVKRRIFSRQALRAAIRAREAESRGSRG